MSEATGEQPVLSPREQAIQYIQERDSVRRRRLRVGGPGPTGRAEAEVSAGAAFERVIKRLDSNTKEGLRPILYDAARAYGYTGAIGDLLLGIYTLVAPMGPLSTNNAESVVTSAIKMVAQTGVKATGEFVTWRFRPLTWTAARVADIGGVAVGGAIDLTSTIVNNIFKGGENIAPAASTAQLKV